MSAGIELQPGDTSIWRIVQAIIVLARKWNAQGQVTLTAGATTTVVDRLVAPGATNVSLGDEVMLSPRTANAAAAIATSYISAVGQGTFTITHLNNAQVDKLFGWGVR